MSPFTFLQMILAGIPITSDNQLVGAPGVKEVMVRAVAPGFAYVIGECKRPWEHGQRPALTVKYGFVVVR